MRVLSGIQPSGSLHLGNYFGMMSKMSMAPKLRNAFETAVKLDPSLTEARSALIEYYLQAPSMVGGGADKAVRLLMVTVRLGIAQSMIGVVLWAWCRRGRVRVLPCVRS